MQLHHQLQVFAGPSVFALSATLVPTHDNLLLTFKIEGPIADLIVPPPERNPRFQDELWKSSCCEIFTQWQGEKAYEEWNFSPSGSWVHYGFKQYREPGPSLADSALAHPIQLKSTKDSLLLKVAVPWPAPSAALPSPHTLRYGLSVVLHKKDETREYWALYHAAPKADFHDSKSFIGELIEVRQT